MNIQERKRYNLVIFILFAVGFFLYGGLSSLIWLHPYMGSNDGPFPNLSSSIRPVLSFITFGLMGGWLIASVVGGFWLGIRFIKKYGTVLIVLACIFFFITYIIFVYVGFFMTIPFAIYNIIKISRNRIDPDIPDIIDVKW